MDIKREYFSMSEPLISENHGGEKLHIVVVAADDPLDSRVFSGTTRSMTKALAEEFGEVSVAFPRGRKLLRVISILVRKATRGRIDLWRFPWFVGIASLDLRKQLEKIDGDLIVAVAASGLSAKLGEDFPTVHVSDTTFALMRKFYPSFRNLSEMTASHGEGLERASIENSVGVVVSSPWAARSVIEHYKKEPAKVLDAPWGCNFEAVPVEEAIVEDADRSICRLLFVGLDWERKGGEIVLDTAVQLERRGFHFQVDIVGASPPSIPDLAQIHVHGILRKSVREEADKLRSLFRNASFLFLPTRQDCTPMVFAEANAYAVPAISADVGGVRGVVREGKSGFVLPADAKAGEFADLIVRAWSDQTSYLDLRRTARLAYEEEFNWTVWAKRFRSFVESSVQLKVTGVIS